MATEKEAISKAPAGRVTRTPVGQRNILTVAGKDPNYVYRIVNDIDDNVLRYEQAGYEFCDDSTHTVGDRRASQGTNIGSKKMFSVGRGTKAFLMRIKRDWYDEDQRVKQKFVADQEASTKPQDKDPDGKYYGSLKITSTAD